MSDISVTIESSRRRFLKALLAGGVVIGAGVLGYELGISSVKCPPCPPCPSTTTTTPTTTPTSSNATSGGVVVTGTSPSSSSSTTSPTTSALSCPNLPYGYDYVIYTSNGNYYVVDPSRGSDPTYQFSDPGSALNYVVGKLSGVGGRVLIMRGVYVCKSYPCATITNSSSSGVPGMLIIEGEDPTGVIFTVGNGVANTSGQGLLVINGSFIWLRRIGVNGNAGNNTYSVGGQFNIAIANSKFVWLDSIYSTNGPGAVGILNSGSVAVSNVISEGDSIGAYVNNSDTVLIGNSSLRGSANYGVEVASSTNTVLYGNSIIDAANGVLINDGDVLIDASSIDFINVSGNYGIKALISTAGREVIINDSTITGSVANAINAAINTAGRLGLQNVAVQAGTSSVLNVTSTPGTGAELVIIGASFKDLVTTSGANPYVVNGVDNVSIINSMFQFGNQTSSANGPSISNVKNLVLRGNSVVGYSTGFNVNNCTNTYAYHNYFSSVTTPVSYTNVPYFMARENIGWTPSVTTPSVPSSGTPVTNTNPVPVIVCVYGGSVTQITLTKNGQSIIVFQSSTGVAINGECFRLNPGDSITINYTQAPSWAWVPA